MVNFFLFYVKQLQSQLIAVIHAVQHHGTSNYLLQTEHKNVVKLSDL